MVTNKKTGLIECGTSSNDMELRHKDYSKNYDIKKIFVEDTNSAGLVKTLYPEVEIVNDKNAIINDSTIDLVVISGAHAKSMDVVGEVLQSGKHLQIL